MSNVINSHFYQFSLTPHGNFPTAQLLFGRLTNEITRSVYRITEDYPSLKKTIKIVSISKSDSPSKFEYGLVLTKGAYGKETYFLDKGYDFSTVTDVEKPAFGTKANRGANDIEELHYYCSIRLGVSPDGASVSGVISIPRMQKGITKEEIDGLLAVLFAKILGTSGHYARLIEAYSAKELLEFLQSATELEFIHGIKPSSLDLGEMVMDEEEGRDPVVFKLIAKRENASAFLSYLGLGKDNFNVENLGALRGLRVRGGKNFYNFDTRQFRLKNTFTVPEGLESPIESGNIGFKNDFIKDNLRFIDNNFQHLFV